MHGLHPLGHLASESFEPATADTGLCGSPPGRRPPRPEILNGPAAYGSRPATITLSHYIPIPSHRSATAPIAPNLAVVVSPLECHGHLTFCGATGQRRQTPVTLSRLDTREIPAGCAKVARDGTPPLKAQVDSGSQQIRECCAGGHGRYMTAGRTRAGGRERRNYAAGPRRRHGVVRTAGRRFVRRGWRCSVARVA